jgi:HPr kinase/phosphorylase
VTVASTQVHGVLAVIHGIGLLVRGGSGSGKSNCALELIRRGHHLVADDVVEIRSDAVHHYLVGTPPATLAGRLEVQDVGIIDVQAVFGASALAASHRIDAIIDLVAAVPGQPRRRNAPPPPTRLLGHTLATYAIRVTEAATLANRLEVIAKILRATQAPLAGG